MDNKITRRNFILASACLLIFGDLLLRLKPVRGSSSDFLTKKLGNFYTQGKSAKIVGKEYLRVVPGEADTEALLNLICSFQPHWRTDLIKADRATLLQMFRRQQAHDFESGAIIKVHGWILSRTEGRLCALSALI